jgi:hypothetical protein
MAKRKKIEERAIDVEKGADSFTRACAEVKKLSGFEFCLAVKARAVENKVEYEFLVGEDESALKTELFARQMEAERNL